MGNWIVDHLGWITVGLIALAAAASIVSGSNTARLVKQCIEDGHKEYECRAMLRQPSTSVVPVPVFVQGGR